MDPPYLRLVLGVRLCRLVPAKGKQLLGHKY